MRTRPGIAWVMICGALTAALIPTQPANAQTTTWKLTISSGETGLGETPVLFTVGEKIPTGIYRVTKEGTSLVMSDEVQVFDEDGVRLLAFDIVSLAAKTTAVCELKPVEPSAPLRVTGVALEPQGRNLTIKLDGKLFTEYRTDEGPKPFLYPLIGPNELAFTRSYPMKIVEGETKDHPHHRSVWFTYGKLNGIDFWAEPKGKPFGSIKETSRRPLIQGPVIGRLRTTDDWLGPDGVKVCEDERVLTVYNSRSGRIFDFDVTMKATQGPLDFSDTKEGMFGVRVSSSMDVTKKQGGRIVNSEGLLDDKAWGKSASWVDYSGPIEGKTVGIAILNHPSSFRYPTTWHVRTYGLFAANPFGWHDFGRADSGTFVLPKGQKISFRYRVILHSGDAESAKIRNAFQSYTETPQISLTAE